MSEMGRVLWTSPGRRAGPHPARPFHGLAGRAPPRRMLRDLRRTVGVVGGRPERVLVGGLGVLRGGRPRPATGRCWRERTDAGGACGFPGATLNYAEHALPAPDGTGVASCRGPRPARRRAHRGRAPRPGRGARAGLVRLGVGRGDRVAAYLPNIAEALVAFLATASLGAVWSSCAAGVRRPQRRRPLRPDRAEGAARRRRLPLRRPGHRPRRRGGADPGRAADAGGDGRARLPAARRGGAPARSGALSWAELPAQPGPSTFEAVPSTTRSTSSTRRGPPGCPSRSCTATAASCSST